MPGNLAAPLYVDINSTKAPIPPELTTNYANSEECLTTSLTKVAAFLAVN